MRNRDANIHASKQKPILIIGMHRSGTSMLARILCESGVFMGADAQGNYESVLFMSLNDALLIRCYSTWDNPFGIHLALQNQQTVDGLARFAFNAMRSNANSYLRPVGRDGTDDILDIDFVWGWKDPRNTFTLPVWSRIFPNNKIIHVMRHGVDVANSLFQRDWVQFHKDDNTYWPALSVLKDRLGLHHSRRGWTLEQAFTLWEEYVETATQHIKSRGENALQIRYEDLLQDPQPNLEKVLRFCGLAPGEISPDLIASFDPNRAYAYKREPRLSEFATKWRKTLSRFGY